MIRNTAIILISAAVIALPFVFRQPENVGNWKAGDPVLVVISPHNEAIRNEFGLAFSDWHEQRYGQPVKVDWRVIGGTTEIMRYLAAEYASSFRAWWKAEGNRWPEGGNDMLLDYRFKPGPLPPDITDDPVKEEAWEIKCAMHEAFRANDDAAKFTSRIDVFFGGGTYDHSKAGRQGLAVAPWKEGEAPPGTLTSVGGDVLIPVEMGGETWRGKTYFGTALSTFGICYNPDRLRELGCASPPERWEDLADPVYAGQLGVGDPTKSGSLAKAFEMIIHQQCHDAVRSAGYAPEQVAKYERAIGAARLPDGEMPGEIPAGYQQAIEKGWLNGLKLVQLLGANARYFTDGASKIPLDVSCGNAAAGLAIDFYGRYQAQMSLGPGGEERMVYITPAAGSSVSADPISLLRGAEHRELAVRFLEFVLGEAGQKLWNYAPGTPGGPRRFALRRLPIRRDFYPSDDPAFPSRWREHESHTVDRLADPAVNPYALAKQFSYEARWTGRHFSVQRDLICAMCMDAGEELKAAWKAIQDHGGPEQHPKAMELLHRMPDRPELLTWVSALSVGKRFDRLDIMREWTRFFRESYAEARREAEGDRKSEAGGPRSEVGDRMAEWGEAES